MTSLFGQVGIVTGAAVGIGRALCLALAEQGVRVVALDVDDAGNRATAAVIQEAGGAVRALRCDVSHADQVRAAITQAVEEFGRIDVLVNNAAVWNNTTLLGGGYDEQTAAFAAAIGSCALGSFHCAAAVAPIMARAGGGNIVNLITEHIRQGHHITGLPATGYDCAKFSQWRLTESWAVELRAHKIRVNGLAFGATDTPMLRGVSVKIAESGMHAVDVAQAVLNIIGQGAEGPTGRVFDIGFTGTPRDTSLAQIAALAVQT